MRGFTKITFSLAAIALAIGIGLMTTGLFMGGRPKAANLSFGRGGIVTHVNDLFNLVDESPLDAHTTVGEGQTAGGAGREPSTATDANAEPTAPTSGTQSDIRSMDIEIGGASMEIVTGDAFYVEAEGTKDFTVNTKNGEWEIKYEKIPFARNVHFTVIIPKGYHFEKVELSCGAGIITADGLSTDVLEADVGAGELELTNTVATRKADLEVGMGRLALNGALEGKVSMEAGMGTISLQLQKPADYGYIVEVGMGSVDIGGDSFSGLAVEKRLNTGAATVYEVECGMGTVTVAF